MTLIPIEHPYRLKSAVEAEAFFRALHFFGSRASIGVRGHRTTDPERIERLVKAIEPKRDHTISFERGVLDWNAFTALSKQDFEYLDLSTTKAAYRSWPRYPRTWVHPNSGNEETTEFDPANGHIRAALEEFRRLTDDVLEKGFIRGVTEEAKPALVRFLVACEAAVHAVLHIDLGSARALSRLFDGETFDWGLNLIQVDFPEGRIHGFLITPKAGDEYQAKWQKRITRALEKAKLL